VSYELLLGLYFGESSNADLTSSAARALMHVPTALEEFIPGALTSGQDVVLTGNPGDGKSHVAHVLRERGLLEGTEVYPDLSAGPSDQAVARWQAARGAGKRFLLLGNEGPLLEFLEALREHPALKQEGAELRGQLRKLLVQRKEDLPPPPKRAALIDLADRNVLDRPTIDGLLHRLSSSDFLPDFSRAVESSVGRNLLAFQHPEARDRLARILCAAGRRRGEHVTFRQLWAAIAYATTGGKTLATLRQDLSQDLVGLGTTPLDHLTNPRGRGLLVEAVRCFGDPAATPDPDLDEQLWSAGPPGGDWFGDALPADPPAALWAKGDREGALDVFVRLKRAVALLHPQGERLVSAIERRAGSLGAEGADALRRKIASGLKRIYLSPAEERGAPPWLTEGIPLWVGFSYTDRPAEDRPHVAVRALGETEFDVLRPTRAPWLAGALGPPPEVAWFVHRESGISLKLDPEMFSALEAAASSSGPMPVPEPLQRFLVRLAGWFESSEDLEPDDYPCAMLDRPRGRLGASARVQRGNKGARYA